MATGTFAQGTWRPREELFGHARSTGVEPGTNRAKKREAAKCEAQRRKRGRGKQENGGGTETGADTRLGRGQGARRGARQQSRRGHAKALRADGIDQRGTRREGKEKGLGKTQKDVEVKCGAGMGWRKRHQRARGLGQHQTKKHKGFVGEAGTRECPSRGPSFVRIPLVAAGP